MLNKYLYTAVLAVGLAFSGPLTALAAEQEALIPNDTFFNRQWSLEFINAPQAWAMLEQSSATPTRDIVVAMVDGGIDFTHPDLKDALWENPDETADGQDNDRNGLVDDLHGWNFADGNNQIKPLGKTVVDTGAWEHGTIVASLIAGRGNDDIGMAGVSWKVKLMPLVILGEDGFGGTELLAQAIRYAVRNRADIINLSLEGQEEDSDVAKAIKEATAQGVLVVIAAGNGHEGQGYDLDATPLYPSCHQGAANESVLVVAGLNAQGARHETSNYGSCVSISAPGHGVFAARPAYEADGNRVEVPGYGTWSGTSLAAPLVSGVAALVKAQHPAWTGEQIARKIMATARPFEIGVNSQGLGAGILDAQRALSPEEKDDELYGPWKLLASAAGQPPMAWVVNDQGKTLFTVPVGNPGDKRGVRSSFVRWDEDRRPEVMVSSEGDETGAWRIYRLDGVLLAAGQTAADANDKIKGGVLLAAQDVDADGRDEILLTEAQGHRLWQLTLDGLLDGPLDLADATKSLGNMAVGLQRPIQGFALLSKEQPVSKLYVLSDYGLSDSQDINTSNPERLVMTQGRSDDGREVVVLVQSGKPTYMLERQGLLDVVDYEVPVVWWRHAPLGMAQLDVPGALFYDVWPK